MLRSSALFSATEDESFPQTLGSSTGRTRRYFVFPAREDRDIELLTRSKEDYWVRESA